MPVGAQVSKNNYKWAAPGDVNAFFGLMLDNIADLLLTVGLLAAVFSFPASFAMRYMVPGTAIGVLVGDLIFFWMALRLAKRTGREDITAMPLGLDTPSTIGMVFFVLGPAFVHGKMPVADGGLGLAEFDAAMFTWKIGICSIFISGLFKFACAFGSNWIRRVVPRAGLLGSLAAIALVLICFLPLIEIMPYPIVGLVALSIILTTLVARIPLPGRVPGALGAMLVAAAVYYIMVGTGHIEHDFGREFRNAREALMPTEWTLVFQFGWVSAMGAAMTYMPIVIPFALGTVVGGIDCTESAAAAGDEYDTNQVIGVEAFATLVASLCGGVIQTTPYIGHPAYKAMGGRAAYTLATALFVGGAGLLGYFGFLYAIIPKPTVFPILIFIGLEITAQSFKATKVSHYPALALACIPALAQLAIIFLDELLGTPQDGVQGNPIIAEFLGGQIVEKIHTLRILANGFIVTSLIWSASLAMIIDRRLYSAASYFAVAAACSLFGIMHSPIKGAPMFLPWTLTNEHLRQTPYQFAIGYLLVALMMLGMGWWRQQTAGDG